MTPFTVPRRTERILSSLGASAELRQDVLGDLQEEFTIRAAWDGPAIARRWYYRESLRVALYLLRDWWGRLGRRDVFRLGAVIVWSAIAIVAIQTVGGALAAKLAGLLGVSPQYVLARASQVTRLQTLLTVNGVISLATGYFSASMMPRARLPAALTTATFWALFISTAWIRFPGMAPTWFNVMNLIAVFCAIMLGGVLRASRDDKSDAVALRRQGSWL